MTMSPAFPADTRTPAEREHAERIHVNLRAVLARQGGTLLNEDELRRSRRMTERIDALIYSTSERQRERAFRLMDRQDAIVSGAWHRAAKLGWPIRRRQENRMTSTHIAGSDGAAP